jgi:hypothetical protein
MIQGASTAEWRDALGRRNLLQVKNPATAVRLARLIRGRLKTMKPELWQLIHGGSSIVATQAVLACAIKHSALLGDFLDLVVADQYRRFAKNLTKKLWVNFLDDCRGRDPEMPQWNESTVRRLGSSIFQILAQGGYLQDTRSMLLQCPHIAAEIIGYLERNHEEYVLRCINAGK